MATELTPGSPLDVQLPDGGRLVVSFDLDAAAAAGAEVVVIDAVVSSGGSGERAVEQAVVDAVEAWGLSCSTSATRHPTMIVIR
jgi:hypothetical protein